MACLDISLYTVIVIIVISTTSHSMSFCYESIINVCPKNWILLCSIDNYFPAYISISFHPKFLQLAFMSLTIDILGVTMYVNIPVAGKNISWVFPDVRQRAVSLSIYRTVHVPAPKPKTLYRSSFGAPPTTRKYCTLLPVFSHTLLPLFSFGGI